MPVGPWILGGLGVGSMATGVILWVLGRGERADLYATCGVTHTCAQGDVDRARSKVLAGDVTFVVGLAALGGAVGWALAVPRAPRTSVGIRPVAGGGLLSWQGAF
jgi:hypothetical protein